MEHGVKPVDYVTVHGPHGEPIEWAHENDNVICETPNGRRVQVVYERRSGGGLRVWLGEQGEKRRRLRPVPPEEFSAQWRKTLASFRRQLERLGGSSD
jgi:hypothetical protein